MDNIITIEIDLPEEFEKFFDYLDAYFSITRKEYLESIVKREINSRNSELGIF